VKFILLAEPRREVIMEMKPASDFDLLAAHKALIPSRVTYGRRTSVFPEDYDTGEQETCTCGAKREPQMPRN
jgi:hypothetical protein